MKKVILLLIFSCSFSAFSNDGCKDPFSEAENETKKASEAKPLEAKPSSENTKGVISKWKQLSLEAKSSIAKNTKENSLPSSKPSVTKASANKNETKKASDEARANLKRTYFDKYASKNAMLEMAIRQDNFSSEEKLLKQNKGINIDFLDENGNNFLHLAAISSSSPHSTALLLKAGVDPNVQNINGKTPLHILFDNKRLMSSNHIKAFKVFKAPESPKVAYVANNPESHLQEFFHADPAVEANKQLVRSEIIKLLLLNEADPNIQDKNGLSVLHRAVFAGESFDSIMTLIQLGANVDIKDNDGLTPLHFAVVVEDYVSLAALLGALADKNIQNKDGLTPLHAAIYMKKLNIAEALLKAGADPNIQTVSGLTSLHIAVDTGQADLAEALLKAGVDPNTQDMFGASALHLAISKKDFAFINLFLLNDSLKEKLNVNLKDMGGQTPLHLAVWGNFWFGVKFLLENQADASIKNTFEKTPIDLAKELNLEKIIKLFETHSKPAQKSSKETSTQKFQENPVENPKETSAQETQKISEEVQEKLAENPTKTQ